MEESSSEEDEAPARQPRVRDEQDEEEEQASAATGLGGIGSRKAAPQFSTTTLGSSFSTARMGIGARSGLGSRRPPDVGSSAAPSPMSGQTSGAGSLESSPAPPGLPSSFGSQPQPRQRRSFLPTPAAVQSDGSSRAVNLSSTEKRHFSQLQSKGGVGLKLLEKMGWSAGAGLGTKGQGIATPIQANVRPKGMGLAFEGFRERAAQVAEEERRKGKKKGRTGFGDDATAERVPKRDEVWKKRDKPRKSKVVHRTFEDIVAEVGDAGPDIGLVTDLSGQAVRLSLFCFSKSET
jgi:tuftelin-interacting protein 11